MAIPWKVGGGMEEDKNFPKTRRESVNTGSKYYFTGIPCVHGHISKRLAKNWECYDCVLERQKKSNTHYKHKKHQKTKQRLIHPNQMPKWADKEKIGEMIIEAREKGLVLDHIIPLRGKAKEGQRVSGLHCEDNLQQITLEKNNSKSFNKWPDMW